MASSPNKKLIQWGNFIFDIEKIAKGIACANCGHHVHRRRSQTPPKFVDVSSGSRSRSVTPTPPNSLVNFQSMPHRHLSNTLSLDASTNEPPTKQQQKKFVGVLPNSFSSITPSNSSINFQSIQRRQLSSSPHTISSNKPPAKEPATVSRNLLLPPPYVANKSDNNSNLTALNHIKMLNRSGRRPRGFFTDQELLDQILPDGQVRTAKIVASAKITAYYQIRGNARVPNSKRPKRRATRAASMPPLMYDNNSYLGIARRHRDGRSRSPSVSRHGHAASPRYRHVGKSPLVGDRSIAAGSSRARERRERSPGPGWHRFRDGRISPTSRSLSNRRSPIEQRFVPWEYDDHSNTFSEGSSQNEYDFKNDSKIRNRSSALIDNGPIFSTPPRGHVFQKPPLSPIKRRHRPHSDTSSPSPPPAFVAKRRLFRNGLK